MKFLLDHDVPVEVAHLLRFWGHDVILLKDVLPITASDEQVFQRAQIEEAVVVSCNRAHFLKLAEKVVQTNSPFAGLIILTRRRSRQAECGRLLQLLRHTGDQGLRGNINFA